MSFIERSCSSTNVQLHNYKTVPLRISGKYELCPAVKNLYQLRPYLSTPNMTSCVPRLVRNFISCIERYGCTKCPTIGRFLHSFILIYFSLYTIICTHRELLNDIDNRVVISCYGLMFKPY